MADDDRVRQRETELAAIRERQEACVAQNIATQLQVNAAAQGLLELLRDHPVSGPLSDEAQARVAEVAPALPNLIAQQFALYDDGTPGFYDLPLQLSQIALYDEHGAEQMTALSVEVAGWAASLGALAAQVRLLYELRRRDLL